MHGKKTGELLVMRNGPGRFDRKTSQWKKKESFKGLFTGCLYCALLQAIMQHCWLQNGQRS